MNELYSWLADRHHGLRTFKSFQVELERLAQHQPAQRGLCRLLTQLVDSYVETFDEAPLPIEIADDVHRRLTDLLASLDLQGDSERRLADINRVAEFDLWPMQRDAAEARPRL